MADFKQALDWLNEGKRVRDKEWPKHMYYKKGTNVFFDEKDHETHYFHFNNIFSNDWELYEEKPKHFCCHGDIDTNLGYSECREVEGKFLFFLGGLLSSVSYCPFCGKKASE